MPSYARVATAGQVEEGTVNADSKDAAGAILRRQQIQVTSLREKERRIPLIPKLPAARSIPRSSRSSPASSR